MSRHHERVSPVESWGEQYDSSLLHADDNLCGKRSCPVHDADTSTAKKAHDIPIEERITGVDASGQTPGKYADEHDPSAAWIYPPVYILRCPVCTNRSWAHSSSNVVKISEAARKFQEEKEKKRKK